MRGPTAQWNPDRECWETNQLDLLSGQPDVWSETWPQSGMTHAGTLYALPTPELPTNAARLFVIGYPHGEPWGLRGPQDPAKRRSGGHSVTLQDQVSAMTST